MAKGITRRTNKRLRRKDPGRRAPHRRASDHIMLASRKSGVKRKSGPKQRRPASIREAISGMVKTSSDVIEEQIRVGQAAAERLRFGIVNSRQLNADINMLVESLASTTRQLGATWLQVISIIIRAMGTQPPTQGSSTPAPLSSWSWPGSGTVTQTGKSGEATTSSSMTPADPTVAGVAPQIVVESKRVKDVTLDLHPRSTQFVPYVGQLTAAKGKGTFSSAKFTVDPNSACLILTVSVPARQPAGIYNGLVIDSSTKQPGGTLSVTISR
jgi:hypothetical protein